MLRDALAVQSTAAGPRPRVAVTHHQPPAVGVELVAVRSDVGSNLSFQSRGQHRWRGPFRIDYGKHGRTFPTRVGARALLDSFDLDSPGGYAHRGAHPQVSSIAPAETGIGH